MNYQTQNKSILPHLTLINFNQSSVIFGPEGEIQMLKNKNFAYLNKFSGLHLSYKNILFNRHRSYLTNQWWTAQQGEHNSESTFLSDIDWRYTQLTKKASKLKNDIEIDFPDSEQYYNPRNRRWILTNGDWNYWFNIDTEFKEIYSHSVFESLIQIYKYLNENREMIDFSVTNSFFSSFDLFTFSKKNAIIP